MSRVLEECDIVTCVDKGLEPYGSQVKQTVFWRISMSHGSLVNSLIADPAIFVNVLREIVGSGSAAVEKSIIKELRQAFDIPRKEGPVDLITALKIARNQITGYEERSPLPTSSLGGSMQREWIY
jgi:hypothetical protein